MKLKLDADGHVIVQDGKPVYVHDDGKEVAFDAKQAVTKISQLNDEAKTHRVAKETAENALKAFEGITDADAARAALEMAKNLKDGDLVAAGRVEEIKTAAAKAAQDQVAAQSRTHAEAMKTMNDSMAKLTKNYHDEKLTTAFTGSKFIAEKAAVPPDMLQYRFGSSFKVEDTGLVAYDQAGNKIFSRQRPGEVADFEEAIEQLVGSYSQRDQILKGNNGGGGGFKNGSGVGGKTMARSEFDRLSPEAQRSAIVTDKITVAD